MSPVVAEDEKLEPCGGLFEKDMVGKFSEGGSPQISCSKVESTGILSDLADRHFQFQKETVSELPAAFPIIIADGCVEIPLKEAVENDLHSAGANAS